MIKKSLRLRRIFVTLFTGIWVYVLAAPVFSTDSPLALSLILEKSEYSSGEPVNVVLALKNQGTDPVVVNQRFYISSEEAPQNQKEVYFELISPSGVKLKCQYVYPTGYPKSDYFKLLAPNEEAKSDYPRNLKGFFEITEPGTYTIKAVYENSFGQELGLDVFKGPLVSLPVKFTIVNTKK